MALTAPLRLRVDDPSGVAPARRAAEELATGLGFDDTRRGEVAIVVTELATNLHRHAGGGELILRAAHPTFDVVASDRGPGLESTRAFEDGYSTGGGPGNGLGAIERLSATLDLQSAAGQGTVVAARLGAKVAMPAVDGLALPMAGERESGDAWGHAIEGAMLTLLLADGLGHGSDAAAASNLAVREMRPGVDPVFQLERIHEALRTTRGAAAAIARVDLASGRVDYAGVGNIAATIVDGAHTKSLVSMPGTLGHRVQRVKAFQYELPPGALLVMHSDGLRNGWDLSSYPGLLLRDPLVVASLLIRDFERGRDDVSAVVVRRAR